MMVRVPEGMGQAPHWAILGTRRWGHSRDLAVPRVDLHLVAAPVEGLGGHEFRA